MIYKDYQVRQVLSACDTHNILWSEGYHSVLFVLSIAVQFADGVGGMCERGEYRWFLHCVISMEHVRETNHRVQLGVYLLSYIDDDSQSSDNANNPPH